RSTGRPVTDRRNGMTTPRVDLAAALGVLIGRAVPLLPPPGAEPPAPEPRLSVASIPRASLAGRTIVFGTAALERSVTRRLIVGNAGTGTLPVRVAGSPAWLSARPAKVQVPASSRRTIVLRFRPTRPGAHRGALRLATDDPSAPVLTVAVRGT